MCIRDRELTDEARLLSHHSIDTLEQLNAYEADVKSQLTGLTEQRKSLYLSLIHISTARDEMMAVKKRFGKEEGTVAYHGYQSFAPGEATPELAHELSLIHI